MLSIGQKFPQFSLTGVVSNDLKTAFQPFTQDSFQGKWQIVFFWPKDFTFVCPTEIAAFGKLDKEFKARDAQVLGVSTDSEFVHLAWRKDKEELRTCPSRCWLTSSVSSPARWAFSTPKPASRSAQRSSSTRRVSFASST